MDASDSAVNREQSVLWNGPGGRAWVEAQAVLDDLFRPFETLLVEAVASAGPMAQVLDIGCGTGSTTLAMARRLGAQASCTGLDISEPMITLARQRAEREELHAARFVCADAQVHAFEPAGFDMIVSRFGVMFFEDPGAAFANLRRAAKPGAKLACIVWRSPTDNPFMTAAERAAAPLLPHLPVRQPGAPGQFAFADRGRVAQILADSGWADIDIQPLDVRCTLSEADLMRYISRLGPVGQMLQQLDEPDRAKVLDVMRPAFAPYVREEQVSYTAACWMVTARQP